MFVKEVEGGMCGEGKERNLRKGAEGGGHIGKNKPHLETEGLLEESSLIYLCVQVCTLSPFVFVRHRMIGMHVCLAL